MMTFWRRAAAMAISPRLKSVVLRSLGDARQRRMARIACVRWAYELPLYVTHCCSVATSGR